MKHHHRLSKRQRAALVAAIVICLTVLAIWALTDSAGASSHSVPDAGNRGGCVGGTVGQRAYSEHDAGASEPNR